MNRTLSFLGKYVRRKDRFSMKLLAAFLIVGMLAGSISTSVFAADEMSGGVTEEVTDVIATENATEEQPGDEMTLPKEVSEVLDYGNTEETVKTEALKKTESSEAAKQEKPEEAGTGEAAEQENPEETGIGEATEQENPEETGTGEAAEEESAPEEVPTYATTEEFMAAMDAVGYADDIESQIAAVNNCLNIYDRLSPEDQAANADAGAYIRSYADSINAGNPDEGIETTASYKGTVTLYGTPEAAIKSGPTYGSKVKIDLGTRTGQSWNNVPYTIPQVSQYFVLNDGWTIDYVSVAGNSSGDRQPGASFLLGMSGGSMVYYFKQTAVQKTFTLSYNANGGSGAPNRQTATSTATSYNFTISSTKPTRTGYDFLGWSTNSEATSPSYYGGGTINVTGTTTLYAVWEEKSEQVTLTYMDRGSKYFVDGPRNKGNFTIVNCTNTRNGYEFQGWSANPNSTSVDFSVGETIWLSENKTLYAVWKKKEDQTIATYRVEWYDTEGNFIKDSETRSGTVGTTVEVTDADKSIEGYTFDAGNSGNVINATLSASGTVLKLYFTKDDDNIDNDNGNGISIEKTRVSINGDPNKTTAKTGDTIVWNIKVTNNSNVEKTVILTERLDGATLSKYSVTLAAGASETVTATYVVKDSDADKTLVNTVVGETDKPEEKREDSDEGTPISREITVTWMNGYNDTPIERVTIDKGADYSELYPEDPAREGYIFVGWGDPKEDADGNITITAQWRQLPKLTSITKTLESVSVNGGTPITDLSGLKVKKDDTIVLTYKIIVTGGKDAEYIVSDPGADLAEGSSWTGTLGADGKAEITVTKTVKVTESDANLGKLTVTNRAYVKPGDSTDPVPDHPSNPKDPEKGHPSNEVETDIPVTTIPTDDGKGISIEKTRVAINGDESVITAKVGDTITWNIVVTNNSNVEKTVTLTEKLDGAKLSKDSVTLAPGASETVTATYVVKDTDADKTLVNTVIGKTSPDDPGKESSDPGTEIEAKVYTVTYTDGVDGEEVFADQTTSGLKAGEKTPEFKGTPTREGYEFTGWTPEVAETVTGDAIYVAQWKEKSGTDPEEPTPEEPTPENPTPEEPTPENPTPEEPTPENPAPENPTPEEPTPENPTPEDPTPENPTPEEPTPENPTPEEPAPEDPAPVIPAAAPVEPTVVPPTAPEEEPEVEIEENTPPLAEPEQPEEEESVIPAAEMEIGDEELPLAAGQGRSWALVNFALMNLAIFESLMLLIGYFVNTRKASEEEKEEEEKKLKKKGIMRLISLPVAIISIIAFCLTEDITLPTGFVDRWTILMVIIALVQTVVVAFSRKKEEDEEEKVRA